MKAFAYLRVSGTAQVSGTGFDRQAEVIGAFARGADISIEDTFREEAVSGTNELHSRPAFQDMVNAILSNGVNTIIVEDLSRLARRYAVQEAIISFLVLKEITLISASTGENVTESFQGDPMKRALIQMQGVFSELEKNLLVRKLKKARQTVRSAKGKCEGRKAFGEGPGEAETVGTIVKMHKQGTTLVGIARHLNLSYIKTKMGGEWSPKQVSRVIRRNI